MLSADWYGAVPMSMGSTPVKFALSPCGSDIGVKRPSFKSTFDYLKQGLQQTLLNGGSGCFNLSAQFYVDEDSTPVDDATVEWDVPYVPLASLIIPPQNVWSTAQDAYCRQLSFNPLNSIDEHKGVGLLQEIRNTVYTSQAKLRHSLLNQNANEPTIEDWENYADL